MNRKTTKLGLSLDRTAAQPYYRQIYGRILGAIASGVLKPGDRIPSARALTQELGLARGTIEAAYSLLAERFEQISHAFAGSSPGITQSLVSDFMEEGYFARHIQRMRKLYAERREATAAGLEGVLGKYLHIDPQPGGMHLVLRLRGRRSDRGVVARMREDGLHGEALTDWMAGGSRPSAVLLNFTNVESQRTAEKLALRILARLHP
ncbi:GntR family transcriptional regulator [Variovorax sp. J22R115]|uniref:GntR family transcriptional regulator n=1 Tax=Variovorax sp. J22R115 TaxID=3053509 RepID=UPI0025778175|nr:GntR family transcriptional regulator [Variovorax sp. J22R115]MDM0049735.1 GntR family transcriptional regulator [Variovorax sp. J22R115]